jgi:hypothetical protein
MEDNKSKVEDLVDHAKDYLNTSTEIVELRTTQKIVNAVSASIGSLIIVLIILIFFIFGSIALALVLGTIMGKTYMGFLVLAGFYFIVGLFLWAGKEKLLNKPISNVMIKQIFKDRNEEQD